MSEERETEQAGAPVEQAEATETQLLAAVERAAEAAPGDAVANADGSSDGAAQSEATDAAAEEAAGASEAQAAQVDAAAVHAAQTAQPASGEDRPAIAPVFDPPSAGAVETPTQIFDAQPSHSAAVAAAGAAVAAPASTAPAAPAALLPPERDGEIRINADHPMAALYMQSPMPPEMRGNRGAGVLIALLGTLAFAIVYAGVLALWLAPNYPPSRFLNDGLLPWVLNWGFAAAVVAFFVGLALLVLLVGRAGWWAYMIFGLLVAAFVWAVALLGFGLDSQLNGVRVDWRPFSLLAEFGLFFPVIVAGIAAREVTVWFGAWIGARGRRVTKANAAALTEYEAALAEVQAK